MHHYFSWRLNFLKTVERHVIQIAGTIQVSLLIAHDLLKEMIAAGFPLLLFEQQVVGGRDLVVLVVLDVSYGLTQIAVGTYARSCKTVLDFAEVLIEHGNSILANDYALHLSWLHLLIPFMPSDILHSESLIGIRVEDLAN